MCTSIKNSIVVMTGVFSETWEEYSWYYKETTINIIYSFLYWLLVVSIVFVYFHQWDMFTNNTYVGKNVLVRSGYWLKLRLQEQLFIMSCCKVSCVQGQLKSSNRKYSFTSHNTRGLCIWFIPCNERTPPLFFTELYVPRSGESIRFCISIFLNNLQFLINTNHFGTK